MCCFPEGRGKGAVDGHFGCTRHWVNCVVGTKVFRVIDAYIIGLNEMAKDARKHEPTAPIPSKVFATVSLRQAGMGIKANCSWSSKLIGNDPRVYNHSVTGKAASKHWRPAWVTDTRADSDDDAVADVCVQWRAHYRPSTPELSLDLGTLRKNWKLMHKYASALFATERLVNE